MGFFEEAEPQEAVHEVLYPFEEFLFGEGGSMIGLFEYFFSEGGELSQFEEQVALDDFPAVPFGLFEDVMF